MGNLQFPHSAGPVSVPPALETVDIGEHTFFAQDIEALVLQACRAQGIGFDLFATRFNVPCPALLDILRGHAPVTIHARRILEDFILRALGGNGATAPSSAATHGDPL